MRFGPERLFVGALVLLAGCESEDPVQPNRPNADSAVQSQTIIGDDDQASVVRHLAADASGQAHFSGLLNDDDVSGLSNPGGIVAYATPPMTGVREIRLFPATFGLASEVAVVVGWLRDGDFIDAMIAGVDASGSTVVAHQIHVDQYDTWINDVVLVSTTPSESRFVAGGAARKDAAVYPFTADITLGSDGSILAESHRVIDDDPGASLWWLAWNDDASAPRYFASVGHYGPDGEILDGDVYGLDDTLGVMWQRALNVYGAEWVTGYTISYLSGSVYVVGNTLIEKNGRFRRAGVVASIAESGRLNWCHKVSVSNESDGYFYGTIAGGSLYAAGEYSSVTQRSTKHRFGYGLVSKFTVPAGTVVFHKSFGGERYSSRVLSMEVHDGTAYCGGFTRLFLDGLPWHRGWLVNIDVSNPETVLGPVAEGVTSGHEPARPLWTRGEAPR